MPVPEFSDLQAVLGRVLEVPPETVLRESVAKDFKTWDSIAHANIVLEVEEAFDVEFDDSEIFAFKNVGHIYDTIRQRLGGAA